MKTLFVTLAVALFTFGCNAQNQTEEETNKKEVRKEEQNAPKESWTVKKEMDKNGNVIGYDSTYTWSYSTANGDSMTIDVDSMLQSMHSYFGQTMPSLWDRNFMDPMLRDSLLPHDLFSDNYFEQRWKDQYFDMDKMFQEMDSLRNLFFEEQFPDMKMSPPVRSKPENN